MPQKIKPKITYKPNPLIAMASHYMKPYRLSQDVADKVGIFPEDTGVIVLIILFILDAEKKVCRSKLENYILLLDRKCFEERDTSLFTWDLRNGRIRNFDKFTKFLMEKRLIFSNGSAYFILDKAGQTIVNQYSALLVNIKYWIDALISEWGDKTATQMRSFVSGTKHYKKYQDARTNVLGLMDKQGNRGN